MAQRIVTRSVSEGFLVIPSLADVLAYHWAETDTGQLFSVRNVKRSSLASSVQLFTQPVVAELGIATNQTELESIDDPFQN